MTYVRYSAAEMLGAPIDHIEQASGAKYVYALMESYNIEPTEVARDVTDITPPYWTKNHFSYFAQLMHPEGPVVVEMLPRYADAENYLLDDRGDVSTRGIRRIEVPTDQEVLVIAGPSPRFAGQLCVHEVIGEIDT